MRSALRVRCGRCGGRASYPAWRHAQGVSHGGGPSSTSRPREPSHTALAPRGIAVARTGGSGAHRRARSRGRAHWPGRFGAWDVSHGASRRRCCSLPRHWRCRDVDEPPGARCARWSAGSTRWRHGASGTACSFPAKGAGGRISEWRAPCREATQPLWRLRCAHSVSRPPSAHMGCGATSQRPGRFCSFGSSSTFPKTRRRQTTGPCSRLFRCPASLAYAMTGAITWRGPYRGRGATLT